MDNNGYIEITCSKDKLKKQIKFENIKEIDKIIYTNKITKSSSKDSSIYQAKIESFIEKFRKKLDSKFEFLEKNLYYLDNLEKNEKSAYDSIIKDIIREIIKIEKTEDDILYFIKILFFKSTQKFEKDIDVENLNVIEKYYLDINLNFQKKIEQSVKKATNLCTNLTNEEIKDLKTYITELFAPVNKKLNRFEKNKYFIEKYIKLSLILKKYISKESINNENNIINTEEILKDYSNLKKPFNSQNPYFILSLISKCFEKVGVKIYVCKKNDNKMKNIEIASIQSLFCVGTKKLYDLHFDFGEKQNIKILNDKSEQNKFLISYTEKLSKLLQIKNNNLILSNIRHGSVCTSAFILDPANENQFLNLNMNDRESLNITRIVERPIFNILQINENILDPLGDRDIGWWGVDEIRGGNEYIPPLKDWVGIGLKVLDKYDNGNNDWIDYQNIRGEFSIGYIGIYNLWNDRNQIIQNLNEFAQDINLMERYKIFFNNNFNCGDGICVFQNPDYAENCAGFVDILGFRIKIMLMCRVNPQKIRTCNSPPCWILNPTPDEIRPYRILIKKIPISPLAYDNIITTSNIPIDYILDSINSKDFSFYDYSNTESNNYRRIKRLSKNADFFALKLYTSPDNKFINNYLRTKTIELYSEPEIKSWIFCLHNAIKNGKNKVENGRHVYRGINLKFPE